LIVPCPTCGQSFPDEIGLFSDQFNVKHRRIIKMGAVGARRKEGKQGRELRQQARCLSRKAAALADGERQAPLFLVCHRQPK